MRRLYVKEALANEAVFLAIDEKLLDAYGRIEKTLDVAAIAAECGQPFPLRLMRGAERVITRRESLPKAYRYSKEVGAAIIAHDGKGWYFVRAFRAKCWAGSSVGGVHTAYPASSKDEIVNAWIKSESITFRQEV